MSEAARASRAGSAFGRLGAAAATNPVPTGERPPEITTPRHHDTATPGKAAKVEPIQRFTVRFYEQRDVDGLDLWLLTAKRQLGRKVDKARVVRELLRLAVEEPELTARLYARLREDETP
jgi:hypothetical protein